MKTNKGIKIFGLIILVVIIIASVKMAVTGKFLFGKTHTEIVK
ncbi:MAG: hypothetical protein ABIP51_20605 [Bacteroidia bacterium]